jgi:hypothetical protein
LFRTEQVSVVSKRKLRVQKTDLENLVGNLRGEVGEIVTSWTLLRHLKAEANKRRSPDIAADLRNQSLTTLDILCDKLEDEIVARLSELAEPKVGQLTFHFAAVKLGKLHEQVELFRRFVQHEGLQEKRNLDISHKALPETFADHRHRHIRYKSLLKGVARAARLMKAIDRVVLGPSAPYFWQEMRRKRYTPLVSPKAGYLIMPHVRLSEQARARIIKEELSEGRAVLTEMETVVDGQPASVLVAKEWGGILIAGRLVLLNDYPIQSLQGIDIGPPQLPDC